ncbi:AsmA-like C-terminal region-containing protein [Celerinatantimonas sp. YJH-8]|uniref:AsmA-like C-terminal region-containing protein n=1 Tax=Celerinatantimonas sp. YJH-8 TaxID=3228714 RepID=UPI0038C36560
MRRLKDFLFIVVLIVVAIFTFVIFSFNPDHYQQQIENWAAKQGWQLHYQRSFWQVNHPFDWHIDHITLGHPGVFSLSAEQLDLSVDPMALFSGVLQFSDIRLQAPVVKIALQAAPYQPIHFPWFKTIRITRSHANSVHMDWLNAEGKAELSLEQAQWKLRNGQFQDSDNGYHMQADIIGSAQRLQINDHQLAQPQWQLHLDDGHWKINQVQLPLAGGQLSASGQWNSGKLSLDELTLDAIKWQPDQLPSWSASLWPEFLHQVNIEQLSLNNVNIQTQVQQQPLVINSLDGHISHLQLSANVSDWQAQDAQLTVNNMLLSQLVLNQLQLTGSLTQQNWNIDSLVSDFAAGTLNASLNYQANTQQLHLHELSLSDSELTISPSLQNAWQAFQVSNWLQTITLDQASLNHVKLMVSLPDVALSAQSIQGSVNQLTPFSQGHWQSLSQIWKPDTTFFMQIPVLAYHGLVLSHLSMDIGPTLADPNAATTTPSLPHFNFYAELPQGQLQWSGQIDLNQPNRPWQGDLSGLILDVSPLARLTPSADFELGGDLELQGHLQGSLTQGPTSWQGQLETKSTQLAFNRDLKPIIDTLLQNPRQQLPAHRQLLNSGLSALWQKSTDIPEGSTVLQNLDLKASLEQGQLQVDQTTVSSAPYDWLISGQIDLAHQTYNALGFGITDGQCVLLNRIIDGPWQTPQIRIDHYQLDQSYLPSQDQFVKDPQASGRCQKAATEPVPANNP